MREKIRKEPRVVMTKLGCTLRGPKTKEKAHVTAKSHVALKDDRVDDLL